MLLTVFCLVPFTIYQKRKRQTGSKPCLKLLSIKQILKKHITYSRQGKLPEVPRVSKENNNICRVCFVIDLNIFNIYCNCNLARPSIGKMRKTK